MVGLCVQPTACMQSSRAASRRVDTWHPIALDLLRNRISLEPMRRSTKRCVKILHSAV